MDAQHVILTEHDARNSKYFVMIAGQPHTKMSADTLVEAVGKLVIAKARLLGLRVVEGIINGPAKSTEG